MGVGGKTKPWPTCGRSFSSRAVTQRAHVASFSHRRVGQLKPNKDARKHKYRAAIFMSHYGNEYRDNH